MPKLSFCTHLIYPAILFQIRDFDSNLRENHLILIGWTLVAAVALFSLLRMADIVLSGSPLQYADYWRMLNNFMEADGSLNAAGLFLFNNEHPMVIAQIIYWLNIKAFDGSNVSLGLVDIAIVCLQLGVLTAMLWCSRLEQLEKLALLAFSSAVLFALPGTWNFFKSMSGTAWLGANFFALAAIYARSRDHHVGALLLALLATVSYGTGVIVWPALLATGIAARQPRDWWKEGAYLTGLVAAALWVKGQSQGAAATPTPDFAAFLALAAGQIRCAVAFSDAVPGMLGWLPLIGTPVLALWLGLWVRNKKDCCWIGLAAYAWSAMLLIVFGRGLWLFIHGCQGRYHSLAALTWIAFIALLALAAKTLIERYNERGYHENGSPPEATNGRYSVAMTVVLIATLIPLTASTMAAGKPEVAALQRGLVKQELREIALRLDLLDEKTGYAYFVWGGQDKQFTSRERMVEVGHYPFVNSWNKDCGLLGKTIEIGEQGRTGGHASTARPVRGLARGLQLTGELPAASQLDGPIRCIVVTDNNNVAIGVGVAARNASAQKFIALAPKPLRDFRVYVFDEGHEPIGIAGDFRPFRE